MTAVFAVTAAYAVGCSTHATGARDEGPAHDEPAGRTAASPATSATPSPAPRRVNAVKLVLADPQVSDGVKRNLRRPCATNGYPVDVSYGNLTDATGDDVVVNVMTCDSVGMGSYVYRPEDGRGAGARYQNVFGDEEPPVYSEIDRGDLVVTQKVYEKRDQVAYPSSEDVITYQWSAAEGRFTEQDRTHNDYSNAVGEGKATAQDN